MLKCGVQRLWRHHSQVLWQKQTRSKKKSQNTAGACRAAYKTLCWHTFLRFHFPGHFPQRITHVYTRYHSQCNLGYKYRWSFHRCCYTQHRHGNYEFRACIHWYLTNEEEDNKMSWTETALTSQLSTGYCVLSSKNQNQNKYFSTRQHYTTQYSGGVVYFAATPKHHESSQSPWPAICNICLGVKMVLVLSVAKEVAALPARSHWSARTQAGRAKWTERSTIECKVAFEFSVMVLAGKS